MKLSDYVYSSKAMLYRNHDTKAIYKTYLSNYEKYAFNGNKCIDEKQYEAVITRWYHTIEKGLAYVNYRAGFGKKNIDALLQSMENYIAAGYSRDAFFFQTALSTLNTYIEKNKQHGVENKELEQKVSMLGGTGNEVGGGTAFYSVEFG